MLRAPEVERHWALFLDLDGTLLDIAATPDKVVTPERLTDALVRVQRALDGALAVVSGRSLADVDRLLSPVTFPAGAEHGAVIRLPSGGLNRVPASQRPPVHWARQLAEATRDWTGIIIEEKQYAIAIHYRLAPEREAAAYSLVQSLVNTASESFELLAARKAFEIHPKGITKGHAVSQLMSTEPFRGRQPVFVGDDITDQYGMDVATRLGGMGLNVAAAFGGQPSAVREWLRRAAEGLG
jgi:trehalose 6-phosphate phosphatase